MSGQNIPTLDWLMKLKLCLWTSALFQMCQDHLYEHQNSFLCLAVWATETQIWDRWMMSSTWLIFFLLVLSSFELGICAKKDVSDDKIWVTSCQLWTFNKWLTSSFRSDHVVKKLSNICHFISPNFYSRMSFRLKKDLTCWDGLRVITKIG